MSKLLTILPMEVWFDIVAFFPLANVVNSVQDYPRNELELIKRDRYVKLKEWRNRLLRELLFLWGQSCACQERRVLAPKGSALLEQITLEYLEIRENVHQKIRQISKIIKLPWGYQRCGVGVSYQCMRTYIHIKL
jgi:hypothetical protein